MKARDQDKEENQSNGEARRGWSFRYCFLGMLRAGGARELEFYFRPLNCSDFGDILGDCMTTEMLKALGKQN
jgi:hypothetical protein